LTPPAESQRQIVGKHAWGLTLNDVTGAVYVTRIENADLAVIERDFSEHHHSSRRAIPCASCCEHPDQSALRCHYGDNSVFNSRRGHGAYDCDGFCRHHPKAIAFDATRNLVFVAKYQRWHGDGNRRSKHQGRRDPSCWEEPIRSCRRSRIETGVYVPTRTITILPRL